MTRPRRVDLAYAAGFFDGEGCAMIRNGKGTSIRLDVSIAQNTMPVLEMLKGFFGGNVYGTKSTGGFKPNKQCFQLRLNGDNAARFLVAVFPYLVVKKEDVREVLVAWGIRKEDNAKARELVEQRRARRQGEKDARNTENAGVPDRSAADGSLDGGGS
jgi:hypothetical protein